MRARWLRKSWSLVLFLIVVVVAGLFYVVPFLSWVQQNPNIAQTHAALAIALLTFLLILITAFYAWTTRGTLRLLRRDIEYRTRPIIDINVKAERVTYETEYGEEEGALVKMTIRSTHAPARLVSAEVSYSPSGILSKGEKPKTCTMLVEDEIVPEGETKTFEDVGDPEIPKSHIGVTVLFEDLASLHRYRQTWSGLWGQSPPKLAEERARIKAVLTRPRRKWRFGVFWQTISRYGSSVWNYFFSHDSTR